MTRQEVYSVIDTERDYQEAGKQNPNSHIVSDFPLAAGLLAMEQLLSQARNSWYYEKAPYPITMDLVRKIAGVCIQMGEQYGMPKDNANGIMEELDEIIKKEVIAFTDWLWKNIDENQMATKSWEEWYDEYKKIKEVF